MRSVLFLAWLIASVGAFFWMRRTTAEEVARDPDYHCDPGVNYHLIIAPIFGALICFALLVVFGILGGSIGIDGRR